MRDAAAAVKNADDQNDIILGDIAVNYQVGRDNADPARAPLSGKGC